MVDQTGFELTAEFNKEAVSKGIDSIVGKLKVFERSANTSTATIKRSLESIGDAKLRSKFMDGLDGQLSRARSASATTSRAIVADMERVKRSGDFAKAALAGAFGGLAVGGISAVAGALKDVSREAMSFSDQASSMEAKLTLATAKTGNLAVAQRDVGLIARQTRTDIGAVTDLYSTMARNADTLNLSQKQIALGTTAVGMALKIGGQGASQNAAAILQLSQAMAAGKLAGDEFSSINENAPRLMQLFADAMDVPRGKLKQLAKEGKITSEVIAKALTDPKLTQGLKAEFAKIPVTFADINTAAKNTAVTMAGAFAKGFGLGDSLAEALVNVQNFAVENEATFRQIGQQAREVFASMAEAARNAYSVISSSIQFIQNNFGVLKAVAIGAAVGFSIYGLGAAAAAIRTSAFGQAVLMNGSIVLATARNVGVGAAAQVAFAGATNVATVGVRAFTAALLANPLTAIAVGISTLVSMFVLLADNTDEATRAAQAHAQAQEEQAKQAQKLTEFEMQVAEMTKAAKEETLKKIQASKVSADWDVICANNALSRAKAELQLADSIARRKYEESVKWSGLAGEGAAGAVYGAGKAYERDTQKQRQQQQQAERNLRDAEKRQAELAKQQAIVEKDIARSNSRSGPRASGASDPDKKTSKGMTDAERAAKRYAEAVQKLKDEYNELNVSQEEKAILDALESAGLPRKIDLTNEQVKSIADLVKQLQEGKNAKQVADTLKELEQAQKELTMSGEQLAMVEARRRAGLPLDLAITNAQTAAIDKQAAANYNLAKSEAAKKAVKDVEQDQKYRLEDAQNGRLAIDNPEKAEDERAIQQIHRDRDANIEKIRQLEGINEAKRQELILNEENIAKIDEQNVRLQRQNQQVQKLSNFLQDLWENPKQAMRKFFQDLMKRLIEAILKSIILGEKLGGGGGIGGLLKGAIGGALGIGGGRATGGSVGRGDIRMVGENGPELVSFGAAGQVFNNAATRRAMGGSNVSLNPTYNITLSGNQSQDNMTLAAIKSIQAEQNRQIKAQQNKRGWQ
ncbi:tape measure protein [Sphingobium sp. LSP13-1-1.1]|uniref:tape measure protein n=1 Tax=Sphingobium sp. LSP13-1-1.1 TaxID=3135234 RepID=UPI0034132396